jgi:threonine dehydratase
MITIEDIARARAALVGRIRRTPVVPITQIRQAIPTTAGVVLKLECLQVTGSFKARGAMNRLLGTPPERLRNGIVTASGGNHGIAVARTAHAAGVEARIYLPSNASPEKIARIGQWGATVEVVDGTWDDANRAAAAHAGATGADYFHPFADPLVVAGQGTLGLEILDDLPDMDTILVAIGGGGLIAGLATAIRARRPSVRVIGIEPFGSPTLKTSIDAGRCVELEAVTSRVPTMSCRRTDDRVFELVRNTVDEIVLVTDEQMEDAAGWLWFEMGVAADLSGAASIAALRAIPGLVDGASEVCALICGAGPEGTR